MSLLLRQEKAVPLTRLVLWLALLAWVPSAIAQNNVGELLDAGAKKLSPEEFRQDVVQRTMVGTMPSGARVELMYAASGVVQGRSYQTIQPGTGTTVLPGVAAIASLDGAWTVDERGRICTSMVIERTILPFRCQYWFKLRDAYFIADSEDRGAKVLQRTLKE